MKTQINLKNNNQSQMLRLPFISLNSDLLKLCLITAISIALIGCGSSKVSSGDSVLASTTPSTTPTTVIQGKNYGLSNCSESVGSTEIKFRLTAMSDSVMRVQILSLPDSFKPYNTTRPDSDDGPFLVLRKSAVDPNGNRTDDPSNLKFGFEIKGNNGAIESLARENVYSEFSYQMTEQMMKYSMCDANLLNRKFFSDVTTAYSLSDFYNNVSLSCNNNTLSSDPKNNQLEKKYFDVTNVTNRFFGNADLLVDTKDSTNSFQILSLSVVSKDGRTIFASTEALLPKFVADPNVYKSNHSDSLFQLHPLKDKVGQTWIDSQFVGFTSSLCLY